jgi:hypothetical protein
MLQFAEPSALQSAGSPMPQPVHDQVSLRHTGAFVGHWAFEEHTWHTGAVSTNSCCAQPPVAHCSPEVHAVPAPDFATQTPPEQRNPDLQSTSTVQVPLQLAAPAHT